VPYFGKESLISRRKSICLEIKSRSADDATIFEQSTKTSIVLSMTWFIFLPNSVIIPYSVADERGTGILGMAD
jgi:hypothetical protein